MKKLQTAAMTLPAEPCAVFMMDQWRDGAGLAIARRMDER
jgi:hypothetical protein